jgi:hypothetical protein
VCGSYCDILLLLASSADRPGYFSLFGWNGVRVSGWLEGAERERNAGNDYRYCGLYLHTVESLNEEGTPLIP